MKSKDVTYTIKAGAIGITVEDYSPPPYLAGICEAHESGKYFVENTETGERVSYHKTFRKAYQTAHKMNKEAKAI